MTTGLQRIPAAAARPNPIAALVRFVAAPFRTTAGPPLRRHASSMVSATRSAHDIRRGSRGGSPTRALDLHDGAVMRGVFPPRV